MLNPTTFLPCHRANKLGSNAVYCDVFVGYMHELYLSDLAVKLMYPVCSQR